MPLVIYFDDFEPLNALGSKSTLYKIGAVYSKLVCLPSSIQAQLLHINPVMLFFSEDRKRFSDRVIFSPLVDELNTLQNSGIKFRYRHFNQIKLIPTLICGDNLGLNGILGFTESFSSDHYCRLCRIDKVTAQFQIIDDHTKWRTKENYLADVLLNNLTKTGISEYSVWNTMIGFHVVENLSVDIMHDLLEGVCHYDMAHIITHLIALEWFDIFILNERIQVYNQSSKSSNKIGYLTKAMLDNKRFKCSASEMLYFIESFPFIIDGFLLDEDSPIWQCYIVLRRIIEILMSFSIDNTTIDYLELLIKEHHLYYLDLFCDTLKPKHHFMLHYPSVIRMIGPIRQIWCMRFESKHQFFKNIAKITRNRKNLLQTFSVKLQLSLANLSLNYEEQKIFPSS